MPQLLSSLTMGTLVKDEGTKYYDKPIIWQMIDKNHNGYPDNSITLITKYIITVKPADAAEPNNTERSRKTLGNGRYLHSNIRQWLNSVNRVWYEAQHVHDTPPGVNFVSINAYDSEAGFLTNFSSEFYRNLLPTTLVSARNSYDGGGQDEFVDKIFLPSANESGFTSATPEGSVISFLSNNNNWKTVVSEEAKLNCKPSQDGWRNPYIYWGRTPDPGSASPHALGLINGGPGGNFGYQAAYYGYFGVRPLCNVSNNVVVSDTPDTNGVYTIIWNNPPSPPSSITLLERIVGNRPALISWGSATDNDGTVGSYVLERSSDSDSFIEIFSGNALSYNDQIDGSWDSICYRVKSVDNDGGDSEYITSPVKEVLHNIPPGISGQDTDLGKKTSGFSLSYTVADFDGDNVNVVEAIDNTPIKSFQAILGETNICDITGTTWLKAPNGEHILTISATDSVGSTTVRTHTFTKRITGFTVETKTAMASSKRPIRALINVSRCIPSAAEFKVEICNNAFDETPTWEDATSAVVGNWVHVFENTEKTAESWAVKLCVTVNKRGTDGDCYITAISGTFE